jgi:ABC-type multidrug transport system fused ATPase/permease subunit
MRDKKEKEKVKVSYSSFKRSLRIFRFIGPYKWQFLIGLVFLVLTSATALIFPYFMKRLIDSVSMSTLEINRNGLWLVLLLAAQAATSFFRVVLFVNVTESLLARLRKETYSALVKMPMSFFSQKRVGELNSLISSDLTMIQETFTTNMAEFLRQLIIIVGGIALLFFTSSKLAFLMLATMPAVAIIAVIFGRFIRKLSRQVQDHIAESNTIVEETMQGISNVKSFANEFFEISRYSKSADTIRKKAIKGGKARGSFYSFIIFCMLGSIVLLVWMAVGLQRSGELSGGDLIQFILYTVFVSASIGGIAEQYAQIQKSIGATERLLDILEEPTEPVSVEETVQVVNKISGNVEFREVAFTYPSRKEIQVLSDVSFQALRGEKIAIVGPSGAGKSTLISLLLRFYKPDSGMILIDSKDISVYGLSELRNQMAVVPQDVLLFGGTIRENIAYGKPGATLEEVREAARKANAASFIEGFPEQYETVVGERGIKLSGGQRQRIAIARAVLKDPKILLLDEATSSLDSESEKQVQTALEELMKGRTSFIVAHRLSTIRSADRILVIDKGQVVESGTHHELMEKSEGLYKNLSHLQFQPVE